MLEEVADFFAVVLVSSYLTLSRQLTHRQWLPLPPSLSLSFLYAEVDV
jgi:hypothetical protein